MNSFLRVFSRYLFLGIVILIFFSFFYFHLYDYLSLNIIKTYKSFAQTWTDKHYFLSITLYFFIFTSLVACAIPCATFLTLLGGFLFGIPAILYAEIATTLGGLILFLAVRTTIGSRIAARSVGWIKKIETGFKKNAFNYLLSLRLVPIFPCWVSNISAGMLNMPIKTFLLATAIGIFPSTVIYVLAGQGIDKILTEDNLPLSTLIFTPSVLFPLLGLAILSLFPVFYKYLKKRDTTNESNECNK